GGAATLIRTRAGAAAEWSRGRARLPATGDFERGLRGGGSLGTGAALQATARAIRRPARDHAEDSESQSEPREAPWDPRVQRHALPTGEHVSKGYPNTTTPPMSDVRRPNGRFEKVRLAGLPDNATGESRRVRTRCRDRRDRSLPRDRERANRRDAESRCRSGSSRAAA